MFYVYSLYSETFDKIYIGFSTDVEKRLDAHNDERNKGWTSRYKPWKIIYTEEFDNKTTALKREKQLKTSAGRKFLHVLVEKIK
jgi:putative endonuclease